MRSFAARILVLVLVLSQTWTGALRGLELCIPIGQCEGCRDVAMYGDHGDHGDHVIAHAHGHAHVHVHVHHDGHVHDAHHGDEGCICHIHVDTPDDDTHRGAAPSAGLVVIADLVGVVEAWMLATGALGAPVQSEPPPGPVDPAPSERAVIETTVLLV